MINCEGYRASREKTPFYDKLCRVRNCAKEKSIWTCGDCSNLKSSEKIKMIIGYNDEVLNNLFKKLK